MISIENVDENDNNGIVNVSIGQNVERQDIYWNQTKVITILGRVGGQAIAIIAICQFLIGHFQNFAYEREAINQLYWDARTLPDPGKEEGGKATSRTW